MSRSFFAKRSARVGELCGLAREGMFAILEHSIVPVDRVAVARECRERITAAVEVREIYGPRYVRGAADELNSALELAMRTIEWLWSDRYHQLESERPAELEAAEILAEVVGVIVKAGTLKITRLKELGRTFFRLKESSWFLYQRAQSKTDEFARMNEGLLADIQNGALGLCYTADKICSEITHATHGLRRNRQPQNH